MLRPFQDFDIEELSVTHRDESCVLCSRVCLLINCFYVNDIYALIRGVVCWLTSSLIWVCLFYGRLEISAGIWDLLYNTSISLIIKLEKFNFMFSTFWCVLLGFRSFLFRTAVSGSPETWNYEGMSMHSENVFHLKILNNPLHTSVTVNYDMRSEGIARKCMRNALLLIQFIWIHVRANEFSRGFFPLIS